VEDCLGNLISWYSSTRTFVAKAGKYVASEAEEIVQAGDWTLKFTFRYFFIAQGHSYEYQRNHSKAAYPKRLKDETTKRGRNRS
jgi:cobalamin biosynthesis Mg chelatase CobN